MGLYTATRQIGSYEDIEIIRSSSYGLEEFIRKGLIGVQTYAIMQVDIDMNLVIPSSSETMDIKIFTIVSLERVA